MSGRTMCHEVFERTLLCIHGPVPVNGREWSAYATACRSAEYDGVLVIADPGTPGPNAMERTEVISAFKSRPSFPRVAVVTESAIHRGIVTVLRWIQRNSVAAYSPSSLREALNFARVPLGSQARVVARVHELAGTVNSTWIPRAIRLEQPQEARL